MLPKDSRILQRKKDNFRFLQEILDKLNSLPQHIHFSAAQLEAFHIHVSQLDLGRESQFFKPMPVSQFKKLPRSKFNRFFFRTYDSGLSNAGALRAGLSNYLCDELPEDIQTEECGLFLNFSKWQGGHCQQRDHQLGGNEYGLRPNEQHEWRFEECYDTELDEYPHLISYTLTGFYPTAETESQLTRSEVIMMIDIIMKRMETARLASHEKYPVLMVSCFSRKLRFIQGYFDGDKLHLQYSKFLDFSKFNQETFDLFIRWTMNEPVGDTKAPTKPVPQEPTATRTPKSAVQPQRALGVR